MCSLILAWLVAALPYLHRPLKLMRGYRPLKVARAWLDCILFFFLVRGSILTLVQLFGIDHPNLMRA